MVGLGGWAFLDSLRSARADLITTPVRLGTIQLTIVERGTLESAKNTDVFCRVKTGTQGGGALPQIKEVVADGSHVKEGEVLVQIEDSRFQDLLQTQQIKVDEARSAMIQAEKKVEIDLSQNESDLNTARTGLKLAILDLTKYLEGDYRQLRLDIEGREKIAESDVEIWKDRVAWADRMVLKSYLTPSQAEAERNRLKGAQFSLDKIREERRVLDKYTHERTEIELRSKIDECQQALKRVETQAKAKLTQAETDWKTKQSVHQQEMRRLKEIGLEIDKCIIRAPHDGLVVYYVPESSSRSGSGGPRSVVGQGESVWEGQRLMRIPDLRHMVVNTRVHEAMISRVKVGQEAQIRIDAFPEKVLKGRVKQVANVAAKPDWNSADVKVYPCLVAIEDELEGLRPDMSAEVTIFTDPPREQALIVPVQAIVGTAQQGKYRKCYVQTPDGVQEREVVIGLNNNTHAEVKSGLSEGDLVIVNPRVLLGEKARPANGESKANGQEGRPGNGDDRPPGPGASEPTEEKSGPLPGERPKGGGRPKGGKKGPPPGPEGPPEE